MVYIFFNSFILGPISHKQHFKESILNGNKQEWKLYDKKWNRDNWKFGN